MKNCLFVVLSAMVVLFLVCIFSPVFGQGDAPSLGSADLNNDGTVNVADFLIFIDQFGKSYGDDGYIGVSDLSAEEVVPVLQQMRAQYEELSKQVKGLPRSGAIWAENVTDWYRNELDGLNVYAFRISLADINSNFVMDINGDDFEDVFSYTYSITKIGHRLPGDAMYYYLSGNSDIIAFVRVSPDIVAALNAIEPDVPSELSHTGILVRLTVAKNFPIDVYQSGQNAMMMNRGGQKPGMRRGNTQ